MEERDIEEDATSEREIVEQTDHYDAAIVYAEKNKEIALDIMDKMNKITLPSGEKPKVCLYSDPKCAASKIAAGEEIAKNCTLILVLVTRDLHEDNFAQLIKDEAIGNTRLAKACHKDLKYCVRPLYIEKERDYKAPCGLSAIQSVNWYEKGEKVFERDIRVLFGQHMQYRRMRERAMSRQHSTISRNNQNYGYPSDEFSAPMSPSTSFMGRDNNRQIQSGGQDRSSIIREETVEGDRQDDQEVSSTQAEAARSSNQPSTSASTVDEETDGYSIIQSDLHQADVVEDVSMRNDKGSSSEVKDPESLDTREVGLDAESSGTTAVSSQTSEESANPAGLSSVSDVSAKSSTEDDKQPETKESSDQDTSMTADVLKHHGPAHRPAARCAAPNYQHLSSGDKEISEISSLQNSVCLTDKSQDLPASSRSLPSGAGPTGVKPPSCRLFCKHKRRQDMFVELGRRMVVAGGPCVGGSGHDSDLD